MQLLNLGCGKRIHQSWVNIDFHAAQPGVLECDLSKGLPCLDAGYDVVYHSHLLEHFPKSLAPFIIGECFRVLRPGGVLRVVVPDLEGIVREYLHCLERVRNNDPKAKDDYTWIMLEMYDQVVRNHPGGEMAAYLFQGDIPNEQFVLDRCGLEAKKLIAEGEKQERELPAPARAVFDRVKSLGKFFLQSDFRKEWLLRHLLKDEYKALEIGRFRLSGENHQWMYDSFSLAGLLEDAGFVDVVRRRSDESYIANWSEFNLDTEPDGSVYKPDSIYIEGRKS